jgi:hypothetical protein
MTTQIVVDLEISKALVSNFLLSEPNDFFTPFASWSSAEDPIASIVKSFESNLQSVVLVGTMPFKMASLSVMQRRFTETLLTERFRRIVSDLDDNEEERLKAALETASIKQAERVTAIIEKTENSIPREIGHNLYQSLADPDAKIGICSPR